VSQSKNNIRSLESYGRVASCASQDCQFRKQASNAPVSSEEAILAAKLISSDSRMVISGRLICSAYLPGAESGSMDFCRMIRDYGWQLPQPIQAQPIQVRPQFSNHLWQRLEALSVVQSIMEYKHE
jgi:hypothetical protein